MQWFSFIQLFSPLFINLIGSTKLQTQIFMWVKHFPCAPSDLKQLKLNSKRCRTVKREKMHQPSSPFLGRDIKKVNDVKPVKQP